MRHILFFIVVSFFLSACGGGGSTSTPANSSAPVKGVDLNGLELIEVPGGFQKAIRKNDKGKIVEEGMLKDGKRNGIWAVFNVDRGYPSSVANFVDDKYSGPYFKYNPAGQLELYCSYKDNKLDGYFSKYERSKLIEEGYYQDGQYHGSYTKYFTGKDVPQQKFEYRNGQLHGNAQYFNEQGDLLMEYQYENGEKVSGGVVQNNG